MSIDESILKIVDLQDENLERIDKKNKIERSLNSLKRESGADVQTRQLKLDQLKNEVEAQEILISRNMGIINSIQHEIDVYLKANHIDSYTLKHHESTYRIIYNDDNLNIIGR